MRPFPAHQNLPSSRLRQLILRRGLGVLAALAIVALWAGPLAAQLTPPSYRLGPGDRVSFVVENAPEFSVAFGAVAADGNLSLGPERGAVPVAGLTIEKAEQAIATRLERWLIKADVRLTLDQPRRSAVRVVGAVRPNGQQLIGEGVSLYELLSGLEILESNSGILQIRRAASYGLVEQLELPLSDVLRGLDPKYMLPLVDGDLISIPAGQTVTVYFVDEISRPVEFGADEPKTLIRAVAKAGGLTERSSNRLIITRTNADGTRQIIEARYKRILDGKDPDIELKQGDLIRVKRSLI